VIRCISKLERSRQKKAGEGDAVRSTDALRMLTPPQVAEQLGIDAAKVITWIRSGELPAANVATRVGGRPRWRIGPNDLEAFLERRRSPTPPAPRPKRRRFDGITEFF
jgi:excisionase family DNA binding protein